MLFRSNVKVLLSRVEKNESIIVEKTRDCSGANFWDVDEKNLTIDVDLQKCELRIISSFAVEFGVEGVLAHRSEPLREFVDLPVRIDPVVGVIGQLGEFPTITSRPVAIHAPVPPATFTTSRPRSARYSHARMLRPPAWQIT